MAKRRVIDGMPIEERITEEEALEWGIDKRGRTSQLADMLAK